MVFKGSRANNACYYLLPVGLKGLVAGGLMAALMSSLASVFNSINLQSIFIKKLAQINQKIFSKCWKSSNCCYCWSWYFVIPIMEKIGGGLCINIYKMFKLI